MACWSSENATKAYLQALKMGKRGKEPDVAEFISALAAGNNAQLMVMACSRIATSTTIALVAAAHQTGGRVVCDAENLLMKDYKGADFVLIDCNINGHKSLFRAAKESVKQGLDGGLIVGYNALHNGSSSEFETHFLPIGEGLLVSNRIRGNECGERKKSRWVVTVDKCTGEEHVFRITSSPRKESEA
ncbi:S-adenosyl-L-methionine-dependent methyltransferase [Melia azedarach]|uniref:S-adenosyl-L-methionine-dependent methyltransferase n=1 Tax=Melia azedarach TaxID=155640 RepID=A0ACC1YVE6_MELAZ|nr:S-adenosyl-L-methionine-dependent methyltransferase [Melia azedarach]